MLLANRKRILLSGMKPKTSKIFFYIRTIFPVIPR